MTNRELTTIDAGAPVVSLLFGATDDELIAGLEGGLHVYRDGKRTAAGVGDGGTILSIAKSPSGAVLATVSSDGAVRIWDAKTARLRASLVEFADDEYLAYTPGGAYAGTSEVADRVGWVFDEPLEGFGFEQFAAAYATPDLVRRRLAGHRAHRSRSSPTAARRRRFASRRPRLDV